MRNLLTFSASAVIHSFIAIGAGFVLLTEAEPPKAKNISEVLQWQWVEEAPPPPPVVAVKEPEPVAPEPVQPQPEPIQPQPIPQPVKPEPKPEPVKKVEPKPEPKPVVKPKPVAKPKPKPKPKPRKKPKPRHSVKKKVVHKKTEQQQPVKVEKSSPKEPLFKDFSGQNNAVKARPVVKEKPRANKGGGKSHGQSAPAAKPAPPSVNPNALASYKSGLRAAIERHKKYPRREQRMGITGTAVIAFQVNSDGRLSGIRVARSSGNGKLDAAARAAVAAVGRYQAPPNGQSFNTSVSVGFVLH